jgi:DNA modification methylase
MTTLPTPYWTSPDGRHVIYCADCLTVLPHLTGVDITVSSPPYNQIPETKGTGIFAESPRKFNDGYASHTDNMDEGEYVAWMIDVFGICRDVSAGLVWINHKTRYRNKKGIHPLQIFPWDFYSEIIWDRCGSMTLNARKFAPSHEVVYGFGVPHYWDDSLNTEMTVWRVAPETSVKGHPCPFPVSIPMLIIKASCPFDGCVVDPFMGSGTTGVACIRTGRRFIGVEIEPKYCAIARERMERELSQPCLPTMEPEKVKQEVLL